MAEGDRLRRPEERLRIAILPWGDVIEDYLDPLGLSFERFRTEMDGGWLFGYVEALRRAGTDPFLVCFSREGTGPERLRHEPSGAPLWRIPQPALARRLRSAPRLRHALRGLASYLSTPAGALGRVLRRARCDRILCQEHEYARFDVSVAVGRRLGIPVFSTFQGGDFRTSRLEGPIRPLAVRAAAGFVVATRREACRLRELYGVPAERIARIFNPLDVERWRARPATDARARLGLRPEERVVAWHGRVEMHSKGLDVLLDAWDRVRRQAPEAPHRLVVIGDGPDAGRFRRGVERLDGITWVDRFVMDRDLVRGWLSAADLYVFPSRHEGLPVAPLEAMACGLPVVAARRPGIEDALAPGESAGGLLVPPEDAAALADALRQLLGDDARRKRLGAAARRRAVEAFSYDAVGHRLRAFLASGVAT